MTYSEKKCNYFKSIALVYINYYITLNENIIISNENFEVRSDHAIKVPSFIEMQSAGGIMEVWLTAFQLLFKVSSIDFYNYKVFK